MLYYFTKSAQNAQRAADMMADGKNYMQIWAGACACFAYDAAGHMIAMEDTPRHFDAVEIWPDMPEKERKYAHQVAAGRQTIREREEKADYILNKERITATDRADLLQLVKVAYHSSGKIEGCYSIDSSAACEFCERMRAAAGQNVLIICGACYAAADSYKEFAWRAHKLNARILSSVLFTVEELRALPLPNGTAAGADGIRCRFNEDGDTINKIHAQNYLRIAAGRPGTMFGYWYKNAPAVEAGLHAEGIRTRADLPHNIRFIHSSLIIGLPAAALWFDDAIFTVYPDAETTAAAIAAGAHECNGKRCRACGYTCYLLRRRAEPLRIAEFLRCNKAKRAAIRAAYDALKARRA